MRVTDEKPRLLPLSEVCPLVAACARAGVAAKVSGLFGGVCGAGNGNLAFHGGRFPSQDVADRYMRRHAGLAAGQRIADATNELAASGQSSPLEIIQGVRPDALIFA